MQNFSMNSIFTITVPQLFCSYIVTTVEPPNKGQDNSVVLSFVERLSSFGGGGVDNVLETTGKTIFGP